MPAVKKLISLFGVYNNYSNVCTVIDAEYTISIRFFASIGSKLLVSCTRTEFGGKEILNISVIIVIV